MLLQGLYQKAAKKIISTLLCVYVAVAVYECEQ